MKYQTFACANVRECPNRTFGAKVKIKKRRAPHEKQEPIAKPTGYRLFGCYMVKYEA
jgi:hypothetical protein